MRFCNWHQYCKYVICIHEYVQNLVFAFIQFSTCSDSSSMLGFRFSFHFVSNEMNISKMHGHTHTHVMLCILYYFNGKLCDHFQVAPSKSNLFSNFVLDFSVGVVCRLWTTKLTAVRLYTLHGSSMLSILNFLFWFLVSFEFLWIRSQFYGWWRQLSPTCLIIYCNRCVKYDTISDICTARTM